MVARGAALDGTRPTDLWRSTEETFGDNCCFHDLCSFAATAIDKLACNAYMLARAINQGSPESAVPDELLDLSGPNKAWTAGDEGR
jgi:hypothetical protein